MERVEKRTTELKNGKKWEVDESLTELDKLEIYRSLAQQLIDKKINGSLYIKSIKRINLMDGYQKIIINYGDVRAIYIIKNH